MNQIKLNQANNIIRDINKLQRLIDRNSCGPTSTEYLEVAAKDEAIVAAVKSKIEKLKAEFEAL